MMRGPLWKKTELFEGGYDHKTVLVVGAGRSGLASAEFLLGRNARVILSDQKDETQVSPRVDALRQVAGSSGKLELELGGHRIESFRQCDLVVLSPGVPADLPYLEESRRLRIPILAEVELAFRHLQGTLLGITGSNGKTTTTTLLAEFLQAAGLKGHAAGNIGFPLISFAARSTPDDIYAIELSSFQLECVQQFRPAVAAMLNLTPDHLDRYPGFDQYAAAKERIFMSQAPTDFAVLNGDDPRTAALAGHLPATPILFSRLIEPAGQGAFVRAGRVMFRDEREECELFDVNTIALRGTHNLENVLAASAIALLAGVSPAAMAQAMKGFKGVEHRLECVEEIDGVEYFNDSKATNVDAAVKSLEAFPGNILLIAGGRDKGSDFTTLRPTVKRRVKRVILIGEAAGKIRAALEGITEFSEASDLSHAIAICRQIAQPGDVVLLAPACASFDMFRNYEHRGQAFKDAVHALRSSA